MKYKNCKKPPSLREAMLGKNVIKRLPDNFFERVLQCEVMLKKSFNMQILQELIYYYTAAVEYYESLDDPKYKHYSHSLNLLLTQPDIVKNLSGNKNSLNHKLEVKKKLESKDKKETVIKVQTLLKQVDCDETKALNTKGMVNNELDNQQSIFQMRKEEKKRKFLLSTSDITEAVQTMKNKRQINTRNANKSFDITADKDDKTDHTDKADEHEILNNIDKSPIVVNRKQCFSNCIWSNKTKGTEVIESKMTNFIIDYERSLKSNVLLNAYKDIENAFSDKELEMMETTRMYTTQIKEAECLLTADGDQMYKEQLGRIIFNLQEEEKEEKDKLEKKYTSKLTQIEDKCNDKEISSNASNYNIQENFKLDIANGLTSKII